MKKMTKKAMWETVLAFEETQANPEIVEGIKKEIALLERKNSNKKPTENQVMAKAIAEKVLEVITTEPMTATMFGEKLAKDFPDKPLTPQRMSAVLNKLVKDYPDKVEKVIIKRQTFFKKVED